MTKKVTVYYTNGTNDETTVPDDEAARPYEALPETDPNVARVDVTDA